MPKAIPTVGKRFHRKGEGRAPCPFLHKIDGDFLRRPIVLLRDCIGYSWVIRGRKVEHVVLELAARLDGVFSRQRLYQARRRSSASTSAQ